MRRILLGVLCVFSCSLFARAQAHFLPLDTEAFSDHVGYVSLFDGRTLHGWAGDPRIWRVADGAIVGESSKNAPISNTYLVYPGLRTRDFTLKLEIHLTSGGTGIQYRSQTGRPWVRNSNFVPTRPQWLLTGPQADDWASTGAKSAEKYTGQLYMENTCGWHQQTTPSGMGNDCPLDILAARGQVVNSGADSKPPRVVGAVGDLHALGAGLRPGDWNELTIIARGAVTMHILNGQLMAVYIDDDTKSAANAAGLIGIELEQTPAKVEVRNVWLKTVNESR